MSIHMQSIDKKFWNAILNSWFRSVETVDGIVVDKPHNARTHVELIKVKYNLNILVFALRVNEFTRFHIVRRPWLCEMHWRFSMRELKMLNNPKLTHTGIWAISHGTRWKCCFHAKEIYSYCE